MTQHLNYRLAIAGFAVMTFVITAGAAPHKNKTEGSGGIIIDDLDKARDIAQELGKNATAAKAAAALHDFAQGKDVFYKAALIGACNGNPSALANETLNLGDSKLAAAILAANAMASYRFEERYSRTIYKNLLEARIKQGQVSPEGGESSQGAGKNARHGLKKQGGKKAALAVALLANLLQDNDPEAVRMAVLAAACIGDKTFKDRILAITNVSPAMKGAQLFYRARLDDPIPDAEFAAQFKEALKDKASYREASAALSDFTLDIPGGALACEAAGLRRQSSALPLLEEALSNPDIRVQMEAIRACGAIGDAGGVPALIQKLPNCSWPVLVKLCQSLGAIPDARAIPPLIERLRKEKGRFRLDLIHALSSIAGSQNGRTAEEWSDWWGKNKASFHVDIVASQTFREKTRVQDVEAPTLGYFYSLPIYSDRLCFVVDSSNSMKNERIASLKENLMQTIQRMDNSVAYNIVNFGGIIEIMKRDALAREKNPGMKRTEDIGLSGGTRSYDAMEIAIRLDETDTLYFLSDGKPVKAEITEWNEMRRALILINHFRPIAIYAVEFNLEGNTRQMVEMTDENFGRYEAVALAGDEGTDDPGVSKGGAKKKKEAGNQGQKKKKK